MFPAQNFCRLDMSDKNFGRSSDVVVVFVVVVDVVVVDIVDVVLVVDVDHV